MFPLVSGEMLGLSVNTLTSDGKYPVGGCENLQPPIQMQLSKKRKMFFTFFLPFQLSNKSFVRKLSQEHRFITSFASQFVKASQMLAKFP